MHELVELDEHYVLDAAAVASSDHPVAEMMSLAAVDSVSMELFSIYENLVNIFQSSFFIPSRTSMSVILICKWIN